MKELYEILEKLVNVYESEMENDRKYEQVSKLWLDYYLLSNRLGIELDFAYQIELLYENECYKILQEPNLDKVDVDMVCGSISRLKKVLKERENGENIGLSEHDVELLMKWSVANARAAYGGFGIDVFKNSLNGFCQIGQALSLMPFENLGLSVTKNSAKISFGYPLIHAFGTVCFPVMEGEGNVRERKYLIDTTYRQFFSSVRCHFGRYYTKKETIGVTNPDPGYFVMNEDFAKSLMRDGYVLLDEKTAEFYGKPFYLSSLSLESFSELKDKNIHYYENILKDQGFYLAKNSDLEGLNLCFPSENFKSR